MKSKIEDGARWTVGLVLALPVALALGTLWGCKPIELPGRDAMVPDNIVVLPGDTKLTFEGNAIKSVQYTACVAATTDAGGPALDATSKCATGMTDVTDRVEWVVEESAMGSFDSTKKGKFSTQVLEKGKAVPAYAGGKTRILAKIAGIIGSANLEVKRINTFYAGTTDSTAGTKFKSATKAGSIVLNYPPNKVLVPPNLGQLELHYTSSGKANDLFMINIYSSYSQTRIYTNDLHYHNLDIKQWLAVGQTNKGQTVRITINGTKAASPTYQSVSASYYLYIAESEIRGGLYYWDTSEPVGIYRYDFEKPTATAEAYYTSKQANDCIGCHALSRGGDLVAFTKTGGSGMTDIFDVKARTSIVKPAGKYRGDIQTFGPNGKEIVVVHKGVLRRRDVNTGAILENIPTSTFKGCKTTKDCTTGEACIGYCSKRTQVCINDAACPKGETCVSPTCRTGLATHPDWSADGTMLAYVHVPYSYYHLHDNGYKVPDDVHFTNGSIYLLKKNKEGKWTTPRMLVKGGGGVNYYYPTFSPNGEWIAFNRSTGDSYSDHDATVYVVSPLYDPTKPDKKKLLRLNAAVNPANMSNSWPRWSPFVQSFRGDTIYWLTFSSLRDYGLRLKNSAVKKYKDKAPQVWMVPFNVSRAAKGQDPNNWPVFWLPFQNVKHHNHIAQWTQKVVAVQ